MPASKGERSSSGPVARSTSFPRTSRITTSRSAPRGSITVTGPVKYPGTYEADGGVNAPPISYSVNGRQFVAVAAGGNYQLGTPRNDDLLVFALPEPSQ